MQRNTPVNKRGNIIKIKKEKIFIIGRNKTGTTSLAQAMSILGYRVANQWRAEELLWSWARRDFRGIIRHCEQADAFQDIPFSLDYTFQILDQAFPQAKFILSLRKSSEEWYESVERWYLKGLGNKNLRTVEQLKDIHYHYKGAVWDGLKIAVGIDESTLHDRARYIDYYESHTRNVSNYFRYKMDKLLVIDIAASDSMENICRFLNVEYRSQKIPHLNSSAYPMWMTPV